MLAIARVVTVVVALVLANFARAEVGDPYVGCFEAAEIDAMNYVDVSLARKILVRQRDREFDKLRVTLKMSRSPDGTVSNAEFLKRSDLPELDEVSRKIALASKVLCPTQPETPVVVDIFHWAMHLSADEQAARIKGVALPGRSISNFRDKNPENPVHGQPCDVIRDANGVAKMANCKLDGFCKPTKTVPPSFPDLEYVNGVYGMTLVEAQVMEDGKPTALKVIRSSGNSKLDYAAIRSWEATRFECKGSNPDRRVRMFYDFGKPLKPPVRRY